MDAETILEAALAGHNPCLRPNARAYEEHVAAWMKSHERRFTAASNASTGELELHMLDVIGEDWWSGGGITASSVKSKLDANPNAKSVRVLIDSPGGDAFMGIAIQALLKRHPAQVYMEVIGEASSAASIITMAGDRIQMHEGAMMMVHRAAGGRWGYASDHRAAADALDGITESAVDLYVRRTGKDRKDVQALVDAETWMTAAKAVELGFADEVVAGKGPAVPAAKPAAAKQAAAPARQAAAPESAPALARRLLTPRQRAELSTHPQNRR